MIILSEEDKRKLIQEAIDNDDYFEETELYTDCTVQILENKKTGEISIGWWRNGLREMLM